MVTTIAGPLQAKIVHTQFNYQPLTVEGEIIDGMMMSKIMAYASDASVILPNVTACKVRGHWLLFTSSYQGQSNMLNVGSEG